MPRTLFRFRWEICICSTEPVSSAFGEYSEALKYATEDKTIRAELRTKIQRVSTGSRAEVKALRDP